MENKDNNNNNNSSKSKNENENEIRPTTTTSFTAMEMQHLKVKCLGAKENAYCMKFSFFKNISKNNNSNCF